MKTLLIKVLFISCLSYFLPIKELIHLVFILTSLDFILGAGWAVYKGGIKAFKSRKARRSIVKVLAYQLAIMVGFGVEQVLFNVSDVGYLTKSIAGAVILVEFSSMLETLALITGKQVFRKIFELTSTIFNRNKDLLTNIDPTLDMDDEKLNN